uniref:Centromere protein K n=3 Tax=Poecilia TaxID=8080 RepID=A0A087XFL0_POEFO
MQGEVRADRRAAGQLSEAAESELVQQCEEQFAQLEKNLACKFTIGTSSFLPGSSVDLYVVAFRLAATDAELKLWMSMQPSSLAANAEILLHAGKDEMLKLCSELEMVVSCCEAKRDKLRETKELEQKWLEEKKQVLLAANDHIERLRVEKEKYSEHNILLETKAKIQKMKAYQEQLMESLGDILEKHVPLPQDESTASKKKKNIPLKISEDLVSLSKILEVLMDKVMNTPHDPYVTIDHTFWPPYVEMLLRYGIAVRHQENNFKIRLETFF